MAKCICGARYVPPTVANPKVVCRQCGAVHKIIAPVQYGGVRNPTGKGGAKGGKARAKNLSKAERSAISQLGAIKRWGPKGSREKARRAEMAARVFELARATERLAQTKGEK